MVGDGVGILGEAGRVELREAARLHTADPRYRWVNTLALWGTGTADLARGTIDVRTFVA